MTAPRAAAHVALILLASAEALSCRRPPDARLCRAADAGPALAAPMALQLLLADGLPAEAERRLSRAAELWASFAGAALDVRPAVRRPLRAPLSVGREALGALDAAAARHALLSPLGDVVSLTAPPDLAAVAIVLLPDLAPPDSAAAGELPELTGLGIPASLAPPLGDAPWAAALPRDRAPVVLLSWERWRRLGEREAALLLGHELGHALGLAHDARPDNLMNPGAHPPARISTEQAAAMGEAASLAAAPRHSPAPR